VKSYCIAPPWSFLGFTAAVLWPSLALYLPPLLAPPLCGDPTALATHDSSPERHSRQRRVVCLYGAASGWAGDHLAVDGWAARVLPPGIPYPCDVTGDIAGKFDDDLVPTGRFRAWGGGGGGSGGGRGGVDGCARVEKTGECEKATGCVTARDAERYVERYASPVV
jgi:hypothetical protein